MPLVHPGMAAAAAAVGGSPVEGSPRQQGVGMPQAAAVAGHSLGKAVGTAAAGRAVHRRHPVGSHVPADPATLQAGTQHQQ